MTKRRAEKAGGVKVLHETLDVPEAIKRPPSGLVLAGVSRVVRVPTPTVYRILTTLHSNGYLDRSGEGSYRPWLHSTALGKILLSGMSDAQIVRAVRMGGMPPLTPHTIMGEKALLAEIRRVRAQGYAIDNQENEGDGRCIAAAVRGPNDQVVAAVSISGPVHRMSRPRALSFLPELRAACAAISKTLAQL